jgi:hypothetical protein
MAVCSVISFVALGVYLHEAVRRTNSRLGLHEPFLLYYSSSEGGPDSTVNSTRSAG